ncbi:MAG TPA: histidine phosphatase family protein [Planctomycetota bacterium]|nr:histidine phosphatase family protein [Planctomycetota bacterium]
MEVYLLRHGRTAMNRDGLLQGHTGYGLLPEGVEDARRAAARLAGKGVRLVYSSDLLRALETAAVLRQVLGIRAPIRVSRALREMDYGKMNGLPGTVVEARCPLWRKDPAFVFPGGESYARVQRRALGWLDRLDRRRPAPRVAVVTHGGWIRTLLAALRGADLAGCLGGAVPHGLVARVTLDGRRRACEILGDVTIFPKGATVTR